MNNYRRHSNKTKEKAKSLRMEGLTHREIGEKLSIAWTTIHYWTKGMILTLEQKKAVIERRYKPTYTEERRKKTSQLARINFSRFWKKPYSRKDLLDKIRKFYLKERRIPLKREFNMYGEYKKLFGSWNNAIKLAGFEPNKVIFSKKFIAEDNHICDSFAEKIIDDWLFQSSIKHKRNIPYPGTKMTADFGIGNTIVEYFGLAGESKAYDEIIKKKKEFCNKNRIKLIEIYPPDFFTKDCKIYLRGLVKKIKKSIYSFPLP